MSSPKIVVGCRVCGDHSSESSASGGALTSESSASAARRYSPVPPTTIGVRPASSARSTSAWASGM